VFICSRKKKIACLCDKFVRALFNKPRLGLLNSDRTNLSQHFGSSVGFYFFFFFGFASAAALASAAGMA
jgi:hypothetical protein